MPSRLTRWPAPTVSTTKPSTIPAAAPPAPSGGARDGAPAAGHGGGAGREPADGCIGAGGDEAVGPGGGIGAFERDAGGPAAVVGGPERVVGSGGLDRLDQQHLSGGRFIHRETVPRGTRPAPIRQDGLFSTASSGHFSARTGGTLGQSPSPHALTPPCASPGWSVYCCVPPWPPCCGRGVCRGRGRWAMRAPSSLLAKPQRHATSAAHDSVSGRRGVRAAVIRQGGSTRARTTLRPSAAGASARGHRLWHVCTPVVEPEMPAGQALGEKPALTCSEAPSPAPDTAEAVAYGLYGVEDARLTAVSRPPNRPIAQQNHAVQKV